MRQWNVDPKFLCRQHLLGEHLEIHMFVGALSKGKKLKGYITNGMLEPHTLRTRHEHLVMEMRKRGYTHNSPLPLFEDPLIAGRIDVQANMVELAKRCDKCRERQQDFL